ncbi:MAG: YmdB family metallophosphoesterase [Oscillospiraceae bacterium]|nr:YmdB family metallophosphoesterase [Oscillospiraceae bacterium]
MRVLFIGDVVSSSGCEFLRKTLPGFKRMQGIDFCVVNGENSAKGNGITLLSYEHILASGADMITGGNHTLRRPEFYGVLDDVYSSALRPFNLHRSAPGRGVAVLERKGLRLGVANLIGSVYMDYAENPFDAADSICDYFNKENVKCFIIDFHAEATSEKRAMGFYVDGRAGALIGTHTHVQTADAQILPNGTAYITDAGMTGVISSVLGVTVNTATAKMKTGLPVRFEQAEGECSMNCVVVEMDEKTGRAVSIERFILT